MVILHVITDLKKGGAELMLARLIAAQLNDPRYVHKVISLRTVGPVGANLRSMGIDVDSVGMLRPWDAPGAFIRLFRKIRAARPDIVQTWMYHADLAGGLAARFARVRNILWGVRIADISPALGVSRVTCRIRRLCALLSRRVPTRIVYVAESARIVHEALGYDSGKSLVIHNGYEVPDAGNIRLAREERRAELGLEPGALLIGTAGRFDPQKNYASFVRVAGRVARRHPDMRVVMMGRGLAADNRMLAEWIAGTGQAERFQLVGEQNDVSGWFAAMDVFVLCSLMEGLPNVVAEAMAAATPCIVTDVGDSALLVGDTGMVVEPRDDEALEAALETMVRSGGDSRRSRGVAARKCIEEEFSIEVAAARFAAVYDGLIPERR